MLGTPSSGSTTQGCDGHGTLNAHIIGGWSTRTGAPHTDAAGFAYGLGVAPFVRVGSSVVFDPSTFTSPSYEELQARARESLEEMNQKTLDEARALGTQEDLIEFEGLTPQMVLALAKDGVFDLQTFATCADWELAGGYTMVDGKRVKDEGVLEPFDVSLEEAQYLVMKARIELGLVNPEDLPAPAEAAGEGEEAEEEETA